MKTKPLLFAILISLPSFILAEEKAPPSSAPLGIIGALEEEVSAIKGLMEGFQVVEIGNKSFYQGTIQNRPVVLTQSGVGKVNAAATTQILITKFGVKEAVFTGVAGGLNPEKKIGDIIIANRITQHDYGIITPQGNTVWRAGSLFFHPNAENSIWFPLDQSSLFKKLSEASASLEVPELPASLAPQGVYKPNVSVGAIVTGDLFVSSEGKRKWLFTAFKADATEMEGGAFAQVCFNNQIDCAVIRSLSDMANENANVDFATFAGYAAKNSAQLVAKLVALY